MVFTVITPYQSNGIERMIAYCYQSILANHNKTCDIAEVLICFFLNFLLSNVIFKLDLDVGKTRKKSFQKRKFLFEGKVCSL
jgi:hypothetical protein